MKVLGCTSVLPKVAFTKNIKHDTVLNTEAKTINLRDRVHNF